MELTERAKIVLKIRYLRKDEQGNIIETPAELFYRVASYVAKAEEFYKTKSIRMD